MPRDNEDEFLIDVLRNDVQAAMFCKLLFWISQTLDDLVDRDREISNEQIIRCFWNALIELPKNQFYARNAAELLPMMEVFMQDWIDATNLEKGSEHDRHIAFVLRDTIGGIVIHVARIVGGFDWAQSRAVEIRRHIHEDSFTEYNGELNA